ncbi:MAG: tetratricopeptide repeat protein [Vicinamibacterales bacterium]
MRLAAALLAAALAAPLAAPAAAQSLASAYDRREALAAYREGVEWLTSERWEQAAEAFQRAIKLEPLLTDAHYGLGQAYMGQERYVSAARAYEGCLEAARLLHGLRESERVGNDREIDDTIREIQDTVRRLGGGSLKARWLQQYIYDLQWRKSSLTARFVAPPGVMLALGSAHFRNGDAQRAEYYWTEAVKTEPRLGEAWNNLAVIYLQTGRKAEAVDAVQKAEAAGFRVNPRLKEDIENMRSGDLVIL